MNSSSPRLSFIGGGNMASGIIGGLVAAGWPADRIRVSDPSESQRDILSGRFNIDAVADNIHCVRDADVVVLAVKPQLLRQVIEPMAAALRETAPLMISIVAGIRCTDTLRWIGAELPFVRIMPNTPALVNRGVSGIWANALASSAQIATATEIMEAVGEVVVVDNEQLIDAVTGVSGSGPAYYFKLMELMMQAAMENGLPAESARTLVIETALGAATLMAKSDVSPEELRRQVTSPGGTTEAGIKAMEAAGIDQAVTAGVNAAVVRSAELSNQFGTA